MSWTEDVPVQASVSLPPDPRLLESLGRNHDLDTAVADLVDNAVDAEASQVLIRFVLRAGSIVSFYVVDDGRGMDAEGLDRAMTIGGQRTYAKRELGKFGLGLKSASFSHADSLIVVAKARSIEPAGRRWLVSSARSDYDCDILAGEFCAAEFGQDWGWARQTGTVVRWDSIRSFPSSSDPEVTERFLQTTADALRLHLGLIFHRYLSDGRLKIRLDSYDATSDEVGAPFHIEAINPFAYAHVVRPDYPKRFTADLDGRPIHLDAHIWPGRSVLNEFRLGGRPVERLAGFYLYRRDRLIQFGGWNGVANADRDLQLARISLEFDEISSPNVRINPEKSRVDVGPHFVRAVEQAIAADGAGFLDYLDDARAAYKLSRSRTRARPRVIAPGKGLDPRVRRSMARELDFLPGEEEIDFRWKKMPAETFFSVDRDARTIWLNARYRGSVLGNERGGLNDAPLIKTLMYLLMEDTFKGSYLGVRDKDNLEMWTAILSAAARAETD